MARGRAQEGGDDEGWESIRKAYMWAQMRKKWAISSPSTF
jgi:hypothetical protein